MTNFLSESPWSWVTSIQRPRKVSTCAWLPLFTSEAKSLWFWSHKKVASSRFRAWIVCTARHSCWSLAKRWRTRGAQKIKFGTSHHVTGFNPIPWLPQLSQANPRWGENSTCKTWLERELRVHSRDQLATFLSLMELQLHHHSLLLLQVCSVRECKIKLTLLLPTAEGKKYLGRKFYNGFAKS